MCVAWHGFPFRPIIPVLPPVHDYTNRKLAHACVTRPLLTPTWGDVRLPKKTKLVSTVQWAPRRSLGRDIATDLATPPETVIGLPEQRPASTRFQTASVPPYLRLAREAYASKRLAPTSSQLTPMRSMATRRCRKAPGTLVLSPRGR